MKKLRWVLGAVAGLVVVLGVLFYVFAFRLPPPDATVHTQTGDKAPDFALASTTAPRETLATLAQGNALVLVIYRGDW